MPTQPTQVEYLDARILETFPNHPFQIKNDEDMGALVDSIYANGVTSPLLVWEREPGLYIILSGHRRCMACLIIVDTTGDEGFYSVPVLIYRDIDLDEATLIMVDENARRERLLPSEKAWSYRMKLEAMRRQGKRTDLTSRPLGEKLGADEFGEFAQDSAIGQDPSCVQDIQEITSAQIEPKLRSNEELALSAGKSRAQIQRYIRLTHLIPQLLKMVDDDRLGFMCGVEISYLKEDEQEMLREQIATLKIIPTLKQASKLKASYKDGKLDADEMRRILTDVRLDDRVSFRVTPPLLKRLDELSTGKKMNRSKLLRGLTFTGDKYYIGEEVIGEIRDTKSKISRIGNLFQMRENWLDRMADNPFLAAKDQTAVRQFLDEERALHAELNELSKIMSRLCDQVFNEANMLNKGGK